MRTIETKVYKFEELTKEAQSKAIEKCYDINVCHDWWECTYNDAKTIELEIEGFDLIYRDNSFLSVEIHF